MKKALLVALLVLVVAISGCTQPPTGQTSLGSQNQQSAIPNPFCRQEPYTAQECKTVYYDEPYQAEECNQVEMKYTTTYLKKEGGLSLVTGCIAIASTNIRNMETEESGYWAVEFTFETLKNREVKETSRHLIYPGESQMFSASYDAHCGEDWDATVRIIPATKTVCKTVTKYKNATRQECQEVTKYRQVCN